LLITITECLLAFAPLEPHLGTFVIFYVVKGCSQLCCKKIKLKIAKKHCVLLCNMPTLSNAGTYNKKVL